MLNTSLRLYKLDAAYLSFMHSLDHRVSVKFNHRPFVGIVLMINKVQYVLPLTSQTTEERGGKKRSYLTTTFVKNSSGEEIANILHNNMFPVKDDVYTELPINSEVDTYEANEIRYIRKNSEEIIEKARKVHDTYICNPSSFLLKICCDFKKLENHYQEYCSGQVKL